MGLKELGEFGFIRRVSRGCLIRNKDVVRAIGDDAAAVTGNPGQLTLVTTDLLVERIHFLRDAMTGSELGHKSLAVNLSDIAAMGGTARDAFISLGIPEDCSIDYLDAVYDGMKALAAEFDVNILGGDTTRSKQDLIINIAVIGSVPESEMLLRSGAMPGDLIVSTGTLGDSRAGLHLMLNQIPADEPALRYLWQAHALPKPYLHEGRYLAQSGGVTAAIDTSDGLSSDIQHIAEESGVGARLYADRFPISDALSTFCRGIESDPVEWALSGGEDYTLVCTVSPEQIESVCRGYEETFASPLHRIGEILEEKKMELVQVSGEVKPFEALGWDHFR